MIDQHSTQSSYKYTQPFVTHSRPIKRTFLRLAEDTYIHTILVHHKVTIMKKSRSSILRYPDGPCCTPGGFRIKTCFLALIAILLCSFLSSASLSAAVPTTPTSFLSADAAAHKDLGAGGASSNSGGSTIYSDSTEPFLYKGQDTPVPTLVEHVVVDSSVTFIEEEAFIDLKNLKTVELPASLESIGIGAFYGCTSLVSIEFPASLKTIGDGAFDGCTSLASIEFPADASLDSIGDYGFYGCTSLASIKFPASLETIGDGAFGGCTSLASIEFPADSSLEYIGEDAFEGCTSLASIKFPASLKSILDGAYYLYTTSNGTVRYGAHTYIIALLFVWTSLCTLG